MTTDELVAECREHLRQPRPELTMERVERCLRMTLEMLLSDLDY